MVSAPTASRPIWGKPYLWSTPGGRPLRPCPSKGRVLGVQRVRGLLPRPSPRFRGAPGVMQMTTPWKLIKSQMVNTYILLMDHSFIHFTTQKRNVTSPNAKDFYYKFGFNIWWNNNDCYSYVIQCQMRLRVAVRLWSPLTWSRRPPVGTRAPQKASNSSSQIRSGAVWPTANPWQSRDPQPLVTLQRRPKAEVNLGPPPELKLPYHPGQCNNFFSFRNSQIYNSQNSGVQFKWEFFIQIRMAYLAPNLPLLHLFFGVRKEASRKLSFGWKILIWIGHYSRFIILSFPFYNTSIS